MKKTKLNIEGMQCASCASIIERTLIGLKGIKSVSVSSKNKIAEIEFDENNLLEADIKSRITKLGYKAP